MFIIYIYIYYVYRGFQKWGHPQLIRVIRDLGIPLMNPLGRAGFTLVEVTTAYAVR